MADQPRRKRPTIVDVAQLAGVSHTTVSFVINAVPNAGISEVTRARVHEAIERLDYHPHAGARSMGRRSSRTLGIAIPDDANPHYHEIVAGAEAHAAAHGYAVLVTSTRFDAARELRCFEWLKQQQIDGLILIPSTGTPLDRELRSAGDHGYPVVLLGGQGAADLVQAEAAAGERQLLGHLASLGHRRIGYIYGVADQAVFGARLQACLAVQSELGLPVVERWVRRCGPAVEDGYRTTQALLADCRAPDRPTALIVVNDWLAAAVVAVLSEAGLRIPDMISVAAFDNTAHARYTIVPQLTTVDYEAHRMGELAARLLIDRLADPRRAPVQLITRAQLVVRGSTGPAPAG